MSPRCYFPLSHQYICTSNIVCMCSLCEMMLSLFSSRCAFYITSTQIVVVVVIVAVLFPLSRFVGLTCTYQTNERYKQVLHRVYFIIKILLVISFFPCAFYFSFHFVWMCMCSFGSFSMTLSLFRCSSCLSLLNISLCFFFSPAKKTLTHIHW